MLQDNHFKMSGFVGGYVVLCELALWKVISPLCQHNRVTQKQFPSPRQTKSLKFS